MHRILEDELRGTVVEEESVQPLAMKDSPCLRVLRGVDLTPEQELADVVGRVLEDVPGGANDNIETSVASSPDQPIASWTCLVHGPERRGRRGPPHHHCLVR